tara:strand:+ start:41 stop:664 length:624 start_codon:yes stop_codon:yes gene_type:complete
MYKDYFLFCIVYGTLSIFVLTFAGIIFSVITLLPYWILDNSFGVILATLLGLYFSYLYFKVFLWKIPRLQWRKAGLKDKYYFLLPTSCLIIMLLLSLIAIPKDPQTNKAKAAAAANTLATMVKECAAKKAYGEINPTFSIPEVKHYIFSPVNGDCNGDPNDLLSATSRKPSKYPSFFYNVVTGQKSCLHKGPTESLLGCSARKNGKW